MTRRTPLLLVAGLLAGLPACGHKADPLPPLRRTPPTPPGFRLAQRGAAIELLSRAPKASVDGVAYDAVFVEFLYGAGAIDLEKAGTHVLVRSTPGELVVKTLPLPAPGTLLRATVRAVAAGEKSPKTLTRALVVQAPLEAPSELVARVVEDGVELAWRGEAPKEVPPPPVPTRPGFPGSLPGPRGPGAPDAPTTLKPPAAGGVAAPVPGTAAAPTTGTAERITTEASAEAPATGGTTAAKGDVKPALPKPRRSGFWVYRRTGDAAYGGALTSEPLELKNYRDKTAPLGAQACYVVRAVASSDPLIESGPSNEACVTMRDITPPAPPAGIAVLPRATGLELIWSPSSEPDLAGYRVLRTAPGAKAERIADLGPASTSYLDERAQKGVRYGYAVAAYDAAGNESAPSEAVEASLP